MISTKGRYALRVMAELAGQNDGTFIPLKDIAKNQGISVKYIENIMSVLSKAGLVDAVHGKGGGYRLNRSPDEYSLGVILRLTEGTLAPARCHEFSGKCERAAECSTFPVWTELQKIVEDHLDNKTLSSLIRDKS